MNTNEIINSLEENALCSVEEIEYKKDFIVVKFTYEFDKEELEAAKAYATDESDYEEDSEEWVIEYVIPYLQDIAIDNVQDIVEEIGEDEEAISQFISYDMDINNYTYCDFVAVFSQDEFEIDEVLDELEI